MLSYVFFEGRPLTTRGRWINPLVFALFRIQKLLPQLRRVEKPIFILGTGRSGTTILGMVLSMHREIGFLNEPKALWHAIHPGEDLIGSYSRGAARYRLNREDAPFEVQRAAHRIFGAYLTATGSKRVVDKYPELIFRVPFVKQIFPDAKFLFLVRNGWDTCRSIDGWSNRLGQKVGDEQHDWWGVDRRKWNLLLAQIVPEHPDLSPIALDMENWINQTDMAAVEWIVTMREGLHLLEESPNDVLRISYEELCSEPHSVLEHLCDFVDLPFDETFVRYAERVLSKNKIGDSFELAPDIVRPFCETMKSLGYES
ncbi:sulfotransferase [Geothermobacter hydrogeniphilus]|uniref:Sulfotransferase n=2 Tax=Geothermobacter hydrogeniphilus TaxID=1969733 RepID=A0A2K2HAH3_9BACT|nr:sulfotransferase [Geothermobacter hydrogeniphilus]